jgi:predicted DNA-binding transcriptional regulator AlpA
LRLIDEEGFPPGAMLGRNTRAWALDEVEAWLAAQHAYSGLGFFLSRF